jgi:hypothetical protein
VKDLLTYIVSVVLVLVLVVWTMQRLGVSIYSSVERTFATAAKATR